MHRHTHSGWVTVGQIIGYVLLVWIGIMLHRAHACLPEPPRVPPAPNKGWWQNVDCTWKVVDCPRVELYYDTGTAVRLPVGCTAPSPRITYAPVEDVQLGEELAALRVKAKGLAEEVEAGRRIIDQADARLTQAVQQGLDEIQATRAKSDAALARLEHRAVKAEAESASRWSTLSLVVVGAISGLAGYGLHTLLN